MITIIRKLALKNNLYLNFEDKNLKNVFSDLLKTLMYTKYDA